MLCFVIWIEILIVTCWFKWAYAQPNFTSLNYDEDCLILNAYWTINAIMLFWLIIWWKWLLDLCIISLYEMCECAEVYMHIWYCDGCYCAINNRVLNCRTVKEEGLFRANVVEGLAFKCAYRVMLIKACILWPNYDIYYRDG